MSPVPRHRASDLQTFATRLLEASGLAPDRARVVAEVLLLGDLLGHTTHGLALLAPYLGEIDSGRMAKTGEPVTVRSRPAVQTWDGLRLPGPWLTVRAVDTAAAMAASYGQGTVVIRRSHHIACLAAYLERATARGLAIVVTCSDPNVCSVAPFGGVTPVFTPNPLAAGLPTEGDPILLDISASYTTNGLTGRLHQAGEKLPHPWIQDADGNPTTDPAVLFGDRKGTLLPLGGLDAGHKGYALALLVEGLTAGLAGFGRADPKEGWGATVFVQVFDPDAFGGRSAFTRQMSWLVDACHGAGPRPGGPAVRLPGERGLAAKREQIARGVALHPGIMPSLGTWAQRWSVAPPEPMAS